LVKAILNKFKEDYQFFDEDFAYLFNSYYDKYYNQSE